MVGLFLFDAVRARTVLLRGLINERCLSLCFVSSNFAPSDQETKPTPIGMRLRK